MTVTSEPAAVSPLDGFVGSFSPPRVRFLYTCGLAAVAVAMVLLPIVYLLMIAALAYALWWYATVVWPAWMDVGTLVFSVSPLIAGVILILFMLKPFLAKRPKPTACLTLDPERERLLVAFVDHLCELLGAPRPSRIDVNVWPNAWASLEGGARSVLRRNVVLTIGLPLVAGLNMRELAGVLAHELRHFSQGAGMRLSYVISSVNRWLGRGAFERDKWDEWLGRTRAGGGHVFSLGLALALVSVAVTRSILVRLFRIGQAISSFLLRQMEYDADRCWALVSGSDGCESGIRGLRALAVAAQLVGNDLNRVWQRRELPDDVPSLVTLRVRDAGPLIDHVADTAATRPNRPFFDAGAPKPSRYFDTHPAMEARILAVRRLGVPGVFRSDRPASDLFSNLTELSRTATRQFYEKQNNLSLDDVRLVPSEAVLARSEAVLAQAETDRQDGRTVLDFYEGTPFPISPLPAANPENNSSLEDLLRLLVEARRCMRRERARANDAMRRFNGTGVQLTTLAFARQLSALGVALSQLPQVNVRLEDVDKVGAQEAIARAWTRASVERDALRVKLAPLERAALNRVEAALALLRLTPGTLMGVDVATLLDQALKCSDLFNAFDAPRRAMRELNAGAVVLNLLTNPPTQFDPAVVKRQLAKLHDELMPILCSVVASAGGLPYPLSDGGLRSVAAYLGGPGDFALTVALPRLVALNDQCFIRVIKIVMSVEEAWQTQLATLEAASR